MHVGLFLCWPYIVRPPTPFLLPDLTYRKGNYDSSSGVHLWPHQLRTLRHQLHHDRVNRQPRRGSTELLGGPFCHRADQSSQDPICSPNTQHRLRILSDLSNQLRILAYDSVGRFLFATNLTPGYNKHMRYTTQLHTTPSRHPHKRHVLQYHRTSSIISILAFGVVGSILIIFTRQMNLDANALLVGFGASFIRVTIAYILSLIIAVILALLITANTKVEAVLLPIFDVLQSFPSFALFPILVAALAKAPEAVIISVLTISIIWPILFTIIGAMKNRRQDLEEAATIYGATGWKRLRYFTMPSLYPSIITGSIVGWGEGWEFIIGAELLVSVNYGIGHYLGILGESKENGLLALGIFILMVFLFILNKFIWLPLLHSATQYQSDS